MTALLIILGIIVVLAVFIIGIYNRLVALRQTTNQAWSDIEVQLKQRQDLVPQLVNTVKGYAAHEKGTFKEVVDARAAAMGANSVQGQAQAEGMLTAALGKMFALAEAYPELKANTNFLQLQDTNFRMLKIKSPPRAAFTIIQFKNIIQAASNSLRFLLLAHSALRSVNSLKRLKAVLRCKHRQKSASTKRLFHARSLRPQDAYLE